MSNIQLAANLRFLREQSRLTQKEFSKQLNISRQAYSNYERNVRTPDLDTILLIAQFHQISLDAIVLKNLRYPDSIAENPVPYTISRDESTGHTLYLSAYERRLITDLSAAPPETQQVITGFLENSSKNKKKK